MGSSSGTMLRMGSVGMDVSEFLRRVLEELKPMADRAGGAMRIVLACLLVWVIVLTFRNPMGDLGMILVFVLLQRNKTMTRVAAVFLILALVVSSCWILGIARLSWNIPWLRILLWGGMFWVNYYLMSRFPKLSVVFMPPISFAAIFCFSFDQDPDPNVLIGQLGWVWCAVGLAILASFLAEYLFGAPTALDLLRAEVRRILNHSESHCLARAGGKLSPLTLGVNIGVAKGQATLLQKFGVLTSLQRENCHRILNAVGAIDRMAFEGISHPLLITPSGPIGSLWRAACIDSGNVYSNPLRNTRHPLGRSIGNVQKPLPSPTRSLPGQWSNCPMPGRALMHREPALRLPRFPRNFPRRSEKTSATPSLPQGRPPRRWPVTCSPA